MRVHLLPTDGGAATDDATSDEESGAIGGPDDLRAVIDALEADDGDGDEEGERCDRSGWVEGGRVQKHERVHAVTGTKTPHQRRTHAFSPLLPPPSSRGAEALGLPPPAAFDVDIASDDAVTEVGKIASLVEGMMVVQVSGCGGRCGVGGVCAHQQAACGLVCGAGQGWGGEG